MFFESMDNLGNLSINFPIVVKPTNGFSSQGVSKVDNKEMLVSAINKVQEINLRELGKYVDHKTGIILEEFIDGPEFAIESFSIQGVVHVLSIDYKGDCKGPFFEEGVYIAPANLDEEIKTNIKNQVINAVKALGIINGPSHTELRLNKQNEPFVIEIGTRIGGSGISHFIVNESTGINFMRMAIENALGALDENYDVSPKNNKFAGNYIIPVKGNGVFKKFIGLNDLMKDSRITRLLSFFKDGTIVLPYPHFSGYPGFVLTNHSSYSDCVEFYKYLDEKIQLEYQE